MPGDFPEELRAKAISLRSVLGEKLDRNALARQILEHLEIAYDTLVAGDFEWIRREWTAMTLTIGRWVEVANQRQRIEGVAQGVDENGCLIVRKENGLDQVGIRGDVVLKE